MKEKIKLSDQDFERKVKNFFDYVVKNSNSCLIDKNDGGVIEATMPYRQNKKCLLSTSNSYIHSKGK